MIDLTKKILPVNIEEELKSSYLDYAMSVIVGRALPDVRDGLKPVHRRVLFAMNVIGNDWKKRYKKSARIVGDVIGKYHPHGDSAVYDTIVRMAQNFSLRYTLVDGQGNFGSIDGDSAAAMRYTEVRMSKIARELLIDLEKETVNYVPNYDGSEYMPEVLPTRIPNILLNGASGIAVGMATNIPPHNISEVIDGCIAYIDDENISVKTLMKYIPGPDFPTSAIINGKQGIEDAYSTGRGKIYIRARANIEINKKNGKENIIVNEIPYQVNKARLIEKISYIVKDKRILGINSIRDESDKDGMRIVIEIKRDSIGEVVLNKLFSITKLQVSFGINMVALDHGQPKTMTLKNILSAFLDHRREIVSRRTLFELRKAKKRAHILEGLTIALANIDIIIDLIKNSSTPVKAKNELIATSWLPVIKNDIINNKINNCLHNGLYYLTEEQSQAILDIRLQTLTNLEYKNLINEYKELIININNLSIILTNKNSLIELIKNELISIKEKYADKRKTEIIKKKSDINIEDLIPKENVVVTISYQGYIKYQPLNDYEAQRRGGKGKSASIIKEKDFIDKIIIANTHDTILLFSNFGRMYWMKVYQIPEYSKGKRGKPIVNIIPLESKERITTILPVSKFEKGRNVFMATASGTVKKTSIKEFSRPRNSGIIAVNLNKGDELIGVDLTDGSNEIMLFSAYGKVIRFPENQVRKMGRTATGVRSINLASGDIVVSLIIPKGDGSILTVTKHGYGKRTAKLEYPTKSRATQGVISIKVNKRNGKVVGAVQVNEYDQIMIITDSGKLVRIRVSEVSIVGRNTQGVTLIRTEKKESVVGLQRIAEIID